MEKVKAEMRLGKDQFADVNPDESSLSWMTSSKTPTSSSVSRKSTELSPKAAQKTLQGMSLS